jgi:hypothetical protein
LRRGWNIDSNLLFIFHHADFFSSLFFFIMQ